MQLELQPEFKSESSVQESRSSLKSYIPEFKLGWSITTQAYAHVVQ